MMKRFFVYLLIFLIALMFVLVPLSFRDGVVNYSPFDTERISSSETSDCHCPLKSLKDRLTKIYPDNPHYNDYKTCGNSQLSCSRKTCSMIVSVANPTIDKVVTDFLDWSSWSSDYYDIKTKMDAGELSISATCVNV
jgi:hypothetical protein